MKSVNVEEAPYSDRYNSFPLVFKTRGLFRKSHATMVLALDE